MSAVEVVEKLRCFMSEDNESVSNVDLCCSITVFFFFGQNKNSSGIAL